MKSSHVLFNIASYTAIMMEKIIVKTPGEKMAFLATCLSYLVICNFCSFLVEDTLDFFFLFNQFKIGKWTFFKSFICAFYNCATDVIFFLR